MSEWSVGIDLDAMPDRADREGGWIDWDRVKEDVLPASEGVAQPPGSWSGPRSAMPEEPDDTTRSDYDEAWKELLDQYLPQIIHKGFGRQPVSLVILADLTEQWRPTEYLHEELGCETRFRFLGCKLLDEMERLAEDFSLTAVAAKAQIEALRTVGDPEKRFEIRWRMTRALYEHGFTPEEVRAAYRVLSWMMRLPREMQLTFRRKIIEYEEREKMPYITEIEEMAIERGMECGIERGIERGTILMTLAQLERRFGLLAPVLRSGVEALPLAKAEQLAIALLDFQSIPDLEAWLREQA